MAYSLILSLVFLSGFAGLVYEVLWMKQLGLLFGNTSHAAAATFAAFFAGLAAGSWFWGRRSSATQNPLRIYAWLQLGIAVTALLYFGVLEFYHAIYPALYQGVESRSALLLAKFVLALVLIFPPAFCMGGTIPALGQHVVRRRSAFGAKAALLYGLNTGGAALGALLAGFFFPLWLGFQSTCILAMSISVLVAVTAFLLSRTPSPVPPGFADEEASAPAPENGHAPAALCTGVLTVVCFLSGFGILALEVLWSRIFAQILENSVYTFASILVIVLICLSLGALVSSFLARRRTSPIHTLAVLMLIGGLSVAFMPFVLMRLTDSLEILVSKGSWPSYMGLIFRTGFLAYGPPALLLGTVFPYLMKLEERRAQSAGRSLGRLAAVNTVGAILGSLACGFFLLESLRMWRSLQCIALAYPIALLFLPTGWKTAGLAIRASAAILLVLLFTALDPTGLPTNSIDTARHREEVVETWEGSDCTVTVVRDPHGLAIKINSHYSLGSTGALMIERLQADLPLMVWPETQSIFFLGMGTGITAGSALDPQFENVKRVVACELVPEVVEAARKYMTDVNGFDATNGLFIDPRAEIVIDDGRHVLMATDETFDMVNADLFVPFRSGAGNLYTEEHFRSVRERLNPGGLFVQWIPLYQVTENEFGIIARTMLEVFDTVSLWRNNFQPGDEVVAFIGHTDSEPIPGSDIDCRDDILAAVAGRDHRHLQNLALPLNAKTIPFFYCGNVGAARSLFEDYPVNRDDKPLIEYMAPRTYRRKGDSPIPWFVGPRIFRLIEKLQQITPPETDPLLANRTPAIRRLPRAGAAFHRARIAEVTKDEQACRQAWEHFVAEWTDSHPAPPDTPGKTVE